MKLGLSFIYITFLSYSFAFAENPVFKFQAGECSHRLPGQSFQKYDKLTSIKLEKESILKSESLKGRFIFDGAEANVESELLCRVNSEGEFVLIHGMLKIKVKENFKLRTPSCKFTLKPGRYEITVMEGLGFLKSLEGSGKASNSGMSISFKSGQKAIFTSLGKIDIKVNS